MAGQAPSQTGDGHCPSIGKPIGRMIEYPGTDEWHIQCPTCGTKWGGGSIVLTEHHWPGRGFQHRSQSSERLGYQRRSAEAESQARAEVDDRLEADRTENFRALQRALRNTMTEHAGVVRSDYLKMDPQLQVNPVWSPTTEVVREEIPPVPEEISALFQDVSQEGKLIE